jgi:hypothetical protein
MKWLRTLVRWRARVREFLSLEPLATIVAERVEVEPLKLPEPAPERAHGLPPVALPETWPPAPQSLWPELEGEPAPAQAEGSEPTAELDLEFQQLLHELGAESFEPDRESELRRRDGTIAELQAMLAGLRGLGDQLAAAEQGRAASEEARAAAEEGRAAAEARSSAAEARSAAAQRRSAEAESRAAAAEARSAEAEQRRAGAEARSAEAELRSAEAEARSAALALELEEAHKKLAAGAEPGLERLERELARRLDVLNNERERHAGTREKLLEKKRLAAERWRELQHLRAEVRRLEQALAGAEARLTAPAALPAAVVDEARAARMPLAQLMQTEPSSASGAEMSARLQ